MAAPTALCWVLLHTSIRTWYSKHMDKHTVVPQYEEITYANPELYEYAIPVFATESSVYLLLRYFVSYQYMPLLREAQRRN